MILPMLPFPYSAALSGEVTDGLSYQTLVNWILTTPVQFIGGWKFYTGAFNSVRHFSTNMDVLVVLGSSSAYIYSVIFVLGNLATGGRMLLYRAPMFMGCGDLTAPSTIAYAQSAMVMHSAMAFELSCDPNLDFARGMLAHHIGALDACDVFEREAGAMPTRRCSTSAARMSAPHSNGRSICSPTGSLPTTIQSPRTNARICIRWHVAICRARPRRDDGRKSSYARRHGDRLLGRAERRLCAHDDTASRGAIAMCHILESFGTDTELLSLCDRIVAAQTMEIGEITTWLELTGNGRVARCGARAPNAGCVVPPSPREGAVSLTATRPHAYVQCARAS